MTFSVESVCVSAAKGTPKAAVAEIVLVAGEGVRGDAHAGSGPRQVSFLAGEDVDGLRAEGLTLAAGAFGENIVTRGIDWTSVKSPRSARTATRRAPSSARPAGASCPTGASSPA